MSSQLRSIRLSADERRALRRLCEFAESVMHRRESIELPLLVAALALGFHPDRCEEFLRHLALLDLIVIERERPLRVRVCLARLRRAQALAPPRPTDDIDTPVGIGTRNRERMFAQAIGDARYDDEGRSPRSFRNVTLVAPMRMSNSSCALAWMN